MVEHAGETSPLWCPEHWKNVIKCLSAFQIFALFIQRFIASLLQSFTGIHVISPFSWPIRPMYVSYGIFGSISYSIISFNSLLIYYSSTWRLSRNGVRNNRSSGRIWYVRRTYDVYYNNIHSPAREYQCGMDSAVVVIWRLVNCCMCFPCNSLRTHECNCLVNNLCPFAEAAK